MKKRLLYYSTSYGILPSELYINYPLLPNIHKRLEIMGIKKSYRVLCADMFKYLFKLILLDVIHNNIVFRCPAGTRTSIEMEVVQGEDFKKAYLKGAFQDIDFLASNFTGNTLMLKWATRYGKWKKQIYVSLPLKHLITDYTNNAKSYER